MLRTEKLLALIRLFTTISPESAVSKRWLASTGSKLDKNFMAYIHPVIEKDGPYQKVTLDNVTYLWPQGGKIEALYQILSELTNPNHPHQYIYGQTKISPSDVVLDIGACEGSFSAKCAEIGARVIAVEPSKSMSEMIKRLFEIRGLAEPILCPWLLGEQSRSAYFVDNEQNPGASRVTDTQVSGSYSVEVKTLDQLLAEVGAKVTFIKCDAEGFDAAILKSGYNFLKENRPKIAVTTYHNDNDFCELYDFLTSLGYQVEGKGFLYSNRKLRVQMIHAF